MDFLKTVKARAKAAGKTIVLPETGDTRTLAAAGAVLKEGIAKIILVGKKDEILGRAQDLDLSKAEFIDPENYAGTDGFAAQLYELRKTKGMSGGEARRLVYSNGLFFGVMLVKNGIADGMVAGAAHSTADVLRPCLQIIKTAPGTKLVSSFFVMCVPDCDLGHEGIFVFSDCGLNQNPTAEELAHIAVCSADSFRRLVGAEPVVAMLSHSTKGSARHPDADKVIEATRIAKELAPGLILDGELQLDAAIIPETGAAKAPGSAAAGKANVLIFPDVDAGNIGYKLTERLAKASAFGLITQGLAKPVNDLSRGCSAGDIVGVVAITAAQAAN